MSDQPPPNVYNQPGAMNPNEPLIPNPSMDPQIAPQGVPPMPNQYAPPQGTPVQMVSPMPNQYGQPAMAPPGAVPMPNTIVINQQGPSVTIPPEMFKTNPVTLVCPSCNKTITTLVTTNFSCLACLLCCWTGCVCYLIIQSCRGKDLSCNDADHTCPYCGRLIASYKAC